MPLEYWNQKIRVEGEGHIKLQRDPCLCDLTLFLIETFILFFEFIWKCTVFVLNLAPFLF